MTNPILRDLINSIVFFVILGFVAESIYTMGRDIDSPDPEVLANRGILDVEIKQEPLIIKEVPVLVQDTAIFYVLHPHQDFYLKSCLQDNNIEYMTATFRNFTNANVMAKHLTYTQSRNELLLKSLAMGNNHSYHCFIDGDIVMECDDLSKFMNKVYRANVSISHPWYNNWRIKKCDCDLCGITFTDSSFFCFKKETLHYYFPLNTFCEHLNWSLHEVFLIHDISHRDHDYIYMDPDTEYDNPVHDKKYKDFDLSCVLSYYKTFGISYNESYIIDPHANRHNQTVTCKNIA